jgi:hypothetical protein
MRALLILLLAVPGLAEEITPIPFFVGHLADYDKKFACVAGKTSTLTAKIGYASHRPIFLVWLGEPDAKVKVFGYGKPPFVEGDRIEVCGLFLREKWRGGRLHRDEIYAKTILQGESIGAGKVFLSASDAHLIATHP